MRAFLTRLLHFARRRRYLAIWAAGLVGIALVIAGAYSPFSPLDRLNALVFDTYQKLKPREATESAVAVVDIDDESIRQLGQWPWSRTVLASVIDRLTAEGAAAIGSTSSCPSPTAPRRRWRCAARKSGFPDHLSRVGTPNSTTTGSSPRASPGRRWSPASCCRTGPNAAALRPRPASPSPATIRRPICRPIRAACATLPILDEAAPRHRRLQLPAGGGRRGAPDPAASRARAKVSIRPCRSSC